jgi:prophage tail gpP-like protein
MRQPRISVVAGGMALPGVIAAEVESRRTAAAARFRVRLAASDAAIGMLNDAAARIEVRASVDGADGQLVLGRMDALVRDPLRGTLDLEGRDLAALLLESRPEALFVNRTAGDIAQSLAQAVGLGCDASATSDTVGRLYGAERDRLALARFARATTAWDQLAMLATAEGLRAWVEGEMLHLRADDGGAPVPLDASGTTALRTTWQPALARGVEVVVASWGTRLAQKAEARAGQGGGVRHRIVRPNLTEAEAQALADRAQAEVVRHERAIEAAMPGELTMRPGGAVRFTGVAGWEGAWRIAVLRRTLDARGGFRQFVRMEPG